jgi:hypothetical protein
MFVPQDFFKGIKLFIALPCFGEAPAAHAPSSVLYSLFVILTRKSAAMQSLFF